MPWTYPKLLREMDHRQVPKGAVEEFVRRGKDAFDYLLAAMQSNELNERQAGHAIFLLGHGHLLRFASSEERENFYKILVEWAQDERQPVRTEAVVQLIFAWTQMATQKKNEGVEDVVTIIQQAVEKGLEPKRQKWVLSMLQQEWWQK